MKKQNCWEINKCGREPGGCNIDDLGICPASISKEFNGVNCGSNAGRFCWTVVGTLCTGKIQGTFAQKFKNCFDCDFFKQVRKDEADDFKLSAYDVKRESFNNEKE